MLLESYEIFTVDHTSVAVELTAARPIAYLLTRTLRVAYEHKKVYVYFILNLLGISETVTC